MLEEEHEVLHDLLAERGVDHATLELLRQEIRQPKHHAGLRDKDLHLVLFPFRGIERRNVGYVGEVVAEKAIGGAADPSVGEKEKTRLEEGPEGLVKPGRLRIRD